MRLDNRTENAISEVLATLLIIILVIALAVIIGAYVSGIVKPSGKSAYLVPEAGRLNISDAQVIRLQHKAGDTMMLNGSPSSAHGMHLLGIAVESGGVLYPVNPGSSLSRGSFTPGTSLYIYRQGSAYLVTDNAGAIPSSGAVPPGALTLLLTDESEHVLIARISLETGSATPVTTTPAPTPAPTPVLISTAYLNAAKGGALVSGGSYQFVVTGLWSWIKLDGTSYTLDSGDTVKLVIGSDGYGSLYATSSTINTFSFDDVTLYVNGVSKGRGTITGIWISGYGSQASTLALGVPAAGAWTSFRIDGTTLVSGTDARAVSISGLHAPMNMAATASSVYYDGGASGYTLA